PPPGLHPFPTRRSSDLSALWFLPLYLLLPDRPLWRADGLSIAVQLVYQGPLTGILALYAFNRAVHLLGAARAAAFTALLPLTTLDRKSTRLNSSHVKIS